MANGEAPLAHDNAAAAAEDVSVDLTEHHKALIGDEFRNLKNVLKQPTLATLGETPFAHEDGYEVEHHRIWRRRSGGEDVQRHDHGGIVPKPNDASNAHVEFYPTAEALLEVGMHQVLKSPSDSKFDVIECAPHQPLLLGVIAVSNAGLRVAKYARLTQGNGSDVGVSGGGQDSTRDEHDG
ncbi:hypothetical protein ACHAWF_000509, partial [Thalassiosira exigua]